MSKFILDEHGQIVERPLTAFEEWLMKHGLKGDGVTDDAPAFQKSLKPE